MFDRRHFLLSTAGLLGSAALPFHRALANPKVGGNDLKFIFVMSYGGWDPTRVMANEFSNGFVDMEYDAGPVTIGDLTYVAHKDRPQVDTFFEKYYQQSLIINGILVPSVAHENCLRLMMTGSTSSERSDWPSIIGFTRADDFALPHIVIQGPAYPGAAGSAVTRTGSSGQLEGMLDGSIIDWSDLIAGRPNIQAEARMDSYLERRLAAASQTHLSTAMQSRAGYYQVAQERARELKNLAGVLDWSGGSDLGSQISLAVDALSMGISRCAMLTSSNDYGWDTHADNDMYQSSNFNGLFGHLVNLMEKLEAAPGTTADHLSEETIVVVISEMGRTPQLNLDDGKDHWPYSSALLIGPHITGNRVVGGFDPYYYGLQLDQSTGEVDSNNGHDLNVEELGATLLMAAGIDPNDHLTGVTGFPGLLKG